MQNRSRNLLIVAIAAAVVALGFVFIRNLIDFPVYFAAGRSLISGRRDLYAPDFAAGQVMDYRYPPFFLLAFLPLWTMPYTVAAYTWYLFDVLLITGCIVVLRRIPGPTRFKKTAWSVSSLAVAQYYVMVLHYGNAHMIATLLLFAAFYFAFKEKNLVAALAMSLAITIKLSPVLLLPYFALKGKRRLLVLIGGLLIVVNLVPAAYFGFGENTELLKNWYYHVVADQEFHEINGPINLSLKGQLRRYFTRVDYAQRVDSDVQYPSINVASLTAEQTDTAWMIIAALAFASGLALVWKTTQRNMRHRAAERDQDMAEHGSKERGWLDARAPLEFGVMICVGLLVGPLTSKIYFIALIWPIVCMSNFAAHNSTRAGRFSHRALLLIAAINSVLPLLPGRSIQRLLLVLGVDFYVNCLVLAALTYALIESRLSVARLTAGPQMRDLSTSRTP
jgi:hypothetical protein